MMISGEAQEQRHQSVGQTSAAAAIQAARKAAMASNKRQLQRHT